MQPNRLLEENASKERIKMNMLPSRIEQHSTQRDERQLIHDTPQLAKPPNYGATTQKQQDNGSIIQPLVHEEAWLRQNKNSTRTRRRQESRSRHSHLQNKNTLLLRFLQIFNHLHDWMRDVAFILGSISEDDDFDDGSGGGGSEGESSHDRMTTTTSSVSAAQTQKSRHGDAYTIHSQLSSQARSTTTTTTQVKRLEQLQEEEEDHSSTTTDRNRHPPNSTNPWLRKLKQKHGKNRIGRFVWLFILAIAYSIERCTFKILLDRMGPFRLVVGTQGILGLYMILLGLSMLWTIFSFGGKKICLQLFGKKRNASYSTLSEYLTNSFLMDPNSKIVFLPLADLGST